ncbi:MAG: DUF4037 domain-containing protein [Chloroflexi bacterium]|nr:DUF4037 domain-containing protein [Chloroflexota bacterium]
MNNTFIPGLELSRRFYVEAVRPILDAHYPDLVYDAALIGSGSEVQGLDDWTSTDHGWGPRLQIVLPDLDQAEAIHLALARNLPRRFLGYPTGFVRDEADGSYMLDGAADGLIKHRVTLHTVAGLLADWLNADLPLSAVEWVTAGDQTLRSLTGGGVFHAGLGDLPRLRAELAAYPHDVWLYLLAANWERIGQEEHLMGRAGSRGDALGSALIAGRLVRDIMRLAFLMEGQYAPYPKWFGTVFAQLNCADDLLPDLQAVMAATTWQERERHLVQAYEVMTRWHNQLKISEPLSEAASSFHGRPFRVIWGGQIAATIRAAITDPAVKALPPTLGGIDTISDSTDVLSYPEVKARARAIWRR